MLTEAEVQNNYQQGLRLPKDVTLVTSGHNAPDTVYLSKHIHELSRRPFNGVAT